MKRLVFVLAIAGCWPAIAHAQLGISITPQNYPITDRSGTITLGGSAQTLMAANALRHGCFFQNQSNNDLWINENGTAAAIQPSRWMPPGAAWTCESGGTATTAISIFGGTTGQAYAAREW